MFALVKQRLGGSRLRVACQDGLSRMARIPGSKRRYIRAREGDILIVRPWEVQSDEKCDVVWQYTRSQARKLDWP